MNGRPRKEIIPEIQDRIRQPSDQELSKGLKAMIHIARDRLQKLNSSSQSRI